jgi:hypothetical protein
LLGAGGAFGGAATFLFVLKRVIKGVYTIDLDLKNARLRKQVDNARLEWELEQVRAQPEVRRLHERVRNQRLQLKEAELESDDPPAVP